MVITRMSVRRCLLARYLRDDKGQAMTEYILIIGLIILPIAAVFNLIRDPLRGYLARIVALFSGPGV